MGARVLRLLGENLAWGGYIQPAGNPVAKMLTQLVDKRTDKQERTRNRTEKMRKYGRLQHSRECRPPDTSHAPARLSHRTNARRLHKIR